MRRQLLLLGAILLGAVPPPAGASESGVPTTPTSASLDDVAGLESFFDGAMQVGMSEHHVTGAVVAIVKDGRVLFAKGYGHADLAKATPIDPATSLFRIGSTTKTLTWTAVMQLVEQGRLDLDQDVNTYLKSFKLPNTFGKPVTLRQIMTHTAGFEEGFLGYLLQTDAKQQLPIAAALRRHMPAEVRPPGAMSSYSNYGAALAGLIVEQVSGLPYNEYIEQKIFAPLGMHYATVQEPVPGRLEPNVTTGYAFKNGGKVPQPYEIIGGFRPAGSAAVSALDMTHFMLAHLQEGRYDDRQLLEPPTVRLMHATAFRLDPRFPGMALGFYRQDVNGRDAVAHGGDTNFYHTDMILMPAERFGLFLSFITEDNRIREQVENAFFDKFFPASGARARRLPDAQAQALAEKYSGAYQWTRRNHSDIEKGLNLFTSLKVQPLPNGNLVLAGLGEDPLQFEPIGDDLYREVLHGHIRLAFRTDASGRATHMFFSMLPFMPTERVPWYQASSFWFPVLAGVFLLFLGAIASTYYRWREIRILPPTTKRAVWLSCSVALWGCLTAAGIGGVIGATGINQLAEHIPSALSVALIMPLVFVALTVWLLLRTIVVWRTRAFSTGRRIGYSVTGLAALILCLFFWQWNLLGWHYG